MYTDYEIVTRVSRNILIPPVENSPLIFTSLWLDSSLKSNRPTSQLSEFVIHQSDVATQISSTSEIF